MKPLQTIPALLLALAGQAVHAEGAAGMPEQAARLQSEWAHVNYQVDESDRADAMAELVGSCDAMEEAAAAVESVIWCGIVRSTYAGLASPFSAMKYAKAARKDFEKAIEINGEALSGSAYTSLGTLYFKVPGWPVGFGNDEQAESNLKKGLAINPDGIDPNYFYAEFLYEQGDYARSRDYLLRARQAPPRPDRPVADEGRHAEIEALLAEVEKKVKA